MSVKISAEIIKNKTETNSHMMSEPKILNSVCGNEQFLELPILGRMSGYFLLIEFFKLKINVTNAMFVQVCLRTPTK